MCERCKELEEENKRLWKALNTVVKLTKEELEVGNV